MRIVISVTKTKMQQIIKEYVDKVKPMNLCSEFSKNMINCIDACVFGLEVLGKELKFEELNGAIVSVSIGNFLRKIF